MQRILILGCAGAGKTHLARIIGEALSLPVIHLDQHYWQPNWIEPDKAVWSGRVASLLEASSWVMDGNYGGTLPNRLMAADTAIYLDFSTSLCMTRVLRRTLKYFGRTRGADMTPDCPERFDWAFTKYIWEYRRKHRPRVLASLSHFSGTTIILTSPKEVGDFVAALGVSSHAKVLA